MSENLLNISSTNEQDEADLMKAAMVALVGGHGDIPTGFYDTVTRILDRLHRSEELLRKFADIYAADRSPAPINIYRRALKYFQPRHPKVKKLKFDF